ncbi:MurR/RpiR family transcriptional regulator [Pseudomonas sp. HR96]|uniref:MurR/RpiR family transcriptional regulator n=1 Tax=Pseudomonas sp. HR96 TaxID=1027966 RepID=UPI002A75981E|nr:MurR/RpiR family transcriptional regulator [Pseudomonas sp. HR96]WPO98342.1 MurR/RpiR family transcriptional regulator [Pseudomonas sp. HR96]
MLLIQESSVYDSRLMVQLAKMSRTTRPALRKVCDFILRHPLSSATLTIDILAMRAESSTAAVNRLANAMGMNGYTGLHNALVDNLLRLVAPDEQVHGEVNRRRRSGFSLEQQIRLAKGNLDGVLLGNSSERFDAVVKALQNAKRTYIVGFGASYYLAGLAAASLMPVCSGVSTVSVEGGAEMAAYRLATIASGDVLLAIAMPPYHDEVVRLAQFAQARGATLLALTDSPASPLSALTDLALYAPQAHAVLTNSKVALLGVIEALVAAICLASQDSENLSMRLATDALNYLQEGPRELTCLPGLADEPAVELQQAGPGLR